MVNVMYFIACPSVPIIRSELSDFEVIGVGTDVSIRLSVATLHINLANAVHILSSSVCSASE